MLTRIILTTYRPFAAVVVGGVIWFLLRDSESIHIAFAAGLLITVGAFGNHFAGLLGTLVGFVGAIALLFYMTTNLPIEVKQARGLSYFLAEMPSLRSQVL